MVVSHPFAKCANGWGTEQPGPGTGNDKRCDGSQEDTPAPERDIEMELAKIRNLSDDELVHQEKTTSEQLFRLRFQVSMGQNDGVKKLRQLRKEIAQIKTVAKERELGIRGAVKDVVAETVPAADGKKGAR